ncbi:MAG: phytoene desaturase family protein [Spirochaetota bacterium]
MNTARVVIIGAGIAGLSAGSFLARSGYDTVILEKHSISGGLCTAWKRNGYTIDYCVHWLMGSRPGAGFYGLWDELGAFDNEDGSRTEIVDHESFTQFTFEDGETLTLYSDADRLEAELLRVAPEDERQIRRFTRMLKKLSRFSDGDTGKKLGAGARLRTRLSSLARLPRIVSQARTTIGDYASRFSDPRLRAALSAGIPENWSAISLSLGLAMQHAKCAGYPVGGSLRLARNIERRYRELGGTVRYNASVSEILTDGGRAIGVRLDSGEEVPADYVISAADGYATLNSMLGARFTSPKLQKAHDTYPLFPSSLFVGLGIARDLSHLPHSCMLRLPDPIELPDGSTHERASVTVYNYDPTLAPSGSTFVSVLLNTWNGAYWHEAALNDRPAYDRAKESVAQAVIDNLEAAFGGIREAVEVVDVSTPHTVIRYTGNRSGSYEGFAPTPETLSSSLPKTLPGLSRFAMIGQWTTPGGGLPTAAKDGRDIARRVKRELG